MKNNRKFIFCNILLIIHVICIPLIGQSKLILPSVFSDKMVFQQLTDAAIWGKGEPKTKVEVTASWGNYSSTIVESDSTWNLKIRTPIAGGPYSIIISNQSSKKEINNVLIGEVWLCSGQSNMEMPLAGWPPNDIIINSEEGIRNSQNDSIRFFTVGKDISIEEKDDCLGEWVASEPATSANFSAAAYFFGEKLYRELNIPIGLIHSSWSGTPAESWTNKKYLSQLSEFDSALIKIDQSLPASLELNKWLETFPQINMSKNINNSMWRNLHFDDMECSSLEYDHSDWDVMLLPTKWEQSDLGEFDGVVWFRKTIELPKEWLNKDLRVELGPIDDFDITYVNGIKIGAIEEEGNWQTKRNYTIPKEVNNQSRLVIAVRVNDIRGGGGIYGNPEDMKLVNEEDLLEILIAGEWHYLPVAEFRGMIYFVFGANNREFQNRPILPINITANTPTLLYNAMISPLVPFSLRGVIWYQGESNTGNPKLYEKLFPSLINN